MHETEELVKSLVFELRRGTQVLVVLSQLEQPMYGYSLVEQLKAKTIEIEPGTLYPLLRRIEKQGLLESKWETSSNKPRKYYILSDLGKEVYSLLCKEWDEMHTVMSKLLERKQDETKE